MANINQVIDEVNKLNPELARQIQKYVKTHSYGLVFEKNLPEAVRLYSKVPAVGDTVNILPERGKEESEENKIPWVVENISNGYATIKHVQETKEIILEDIVPLVSYKDVIYPGLKVIDKIERGNSENPYHVVINAENYHALEALTYAYVGKVDCIYIDPPYNTGAKDWKYNNDYVGSDDIYKHSKWLAFIDRRLKLAKKLLNPQDSVLIVTIDEKEYLRLGMLLEQTFPEARIQMISSCMNVGGVPRDKQFYRSDEYVFIVSLGVSGPQKLELPEEWYGAVKNTTRNTIRWRELRRTGAHNLRHEAKNQFYPIFVSIDGKQIIDVGESYYGNNRNEVPAPVNSVAVWPLFPDGREGCWQVSQDTVKDLYKNGFIKLGKFTNVGMAISYIAKGEQEKVKQGIYHIVGHRDDGSIIVNTDDYVASFIPTTQWRITSHDATQYGTRLIRKIMPDRKFPFPKSLYAVEDVLRFFVSNKPDALILDFFAGSGTTAHATMMLNHMDGGHRRCISITNNEVSADEEKIFIKNGLRHGDKEWEEKGIATYITWPRIKAAITGINTNGEPIKGDYKFTEEFPMSEGFKENAIFCELTYESAWPIRLDNAFNAIAPILWMQAGCQGPIIKKIGKSYLTTDYYGVLFDYNCASKFCEKIKSTPTIKTAYVVTDDQRRYSNICKRLPGIKVHRLYETYLRTFEICGEGGLD